MTKKDKKNTAPFFDAEFESTITPLHLLQEIEPLLKEYFVGDFEIIHKALIMRFKNGQSFVMKICEII